MKKGRGRPLGLVGDLARLLNSVDYYSPLPESVLQLVRQGFHAKAASLFQGYFESEEQFFLKRISFAGERATTREKDKITPDALPPQCLDRIESGTPYFVKGFSSSDLPSSDSVLFVPITLDRRLYGLLSISDLKEAEWNKIDLSFALALRQVFELWVGKLSVEKRLVDLSNFIPDPTYLMNKRGEVTLWNESTEEMTGWKASRILGKGNQENSVPFYGKRRPTIPVLIFNPDPAWESSYLELRRERKTIFSKAWCPALPGGGAYLTAKTSVLHDLNHREWGCAHTVRDVTHERQMEIDLHHSKYIFETITDYAGIALVTLQDQKVISSNHVFRELFGVRNVDVGLEDILDIVNRVHSEDRYKTSVNLNRMLKSTRPLRFQFRYLRESAVLHLRCYSQVDRYEGEDKPVVHMIFDDVTRQVEVTHKARLDEMRMFHEDRLTALGLIATGIAHELNQPLSTIKVIVDAVLYGKKQGWPLDKEELYENLNMISEQVGRMAGVIKNIRVFARQDKAQDDVLVRPNDAIHNVFSMIGRQLEVHGIEVHQDLSPNLPPIRTNISRLEQVLMNLIVNARDALDTCGHDHKQLWVRSYCTRGDIIHLEVEDNATGIPKEFLVKIFDPFFTTKEVGQGTGLGLSISNSIISELNGTMEVYNNEKGGATFVVTIPSVGGKDEDSAHRR